MILFFTTSSACNVSRLITNFNSLSLPALLTRRLGPSPPPCQPCEALIFPNYAPGLSTLGHHATRIFRLPKNHISEPLPPKTSQSPRTPLHISIPRERNQSTNNFGARRIARWRGLRRSGRGLCLLGGAIQAHQLGGAAWRLRRSLLLQAPGSAASRDAGGCFLHPAASSSSSQTPITSCRPSRNGVEKEESEGKSGWQLKSQTLRPPPPLLLLQLRNASVELLARVVRTM